MGLRFRRAFKLAPGLRLNLSGSGVSFSLGPRGASVSLGPRGTYLNTGIPGTGLYSRERVGSKATSRALLPNTSSTVEFLVSLNEDGTFLFKDSNGNPLPDDFITVIKKMKASHLRTMMEEMCNRINGEVEQLENVYLDTPSPFENSRQKVSKFSELPPVPPTKKQLGFWASLWKSKRIQRDQEFSEAQSDFEHEYRHWEERKRQHRERAIRKEAFYKDGGKDLKVMEMILMETLQSLNWPRETLVATDIREEGRLIYLDVDLPEIEEMPTKTAKVPNRGFKLSVKPMSTRKIQQLYMQHVHGIGFRLIGELFACFPASKELVFSGYSQRPNPATGQIRDEYLYSVRVDRDVWSRINFPRLSDLDVVEVWTAFDLRRMMTKAGKFTPIEPFV